MQSLPLISVAGLNSEDPAVRAETARQLGVDPIDLRRRNVIPAGAMPYKMPLVTIYDSGDFGSNMDKALAGIDHAGFDARKAATT